MLGFLNVTGEWVFDLIFGMGGAAVVTALLTPVVLSRASLLFADGFSVRTAQALDIRLIGGAMLFGIGWGLSGCRPGPAVVCLLYGYESTIIFCVTMVAGMSIEGQISKWLGHQLGNVEGEFF